jgi:hypothetical protein
MTLASSTSSITGRATWHSIALWPLMLTVVIAGSAYVTPQITSRILLIAIAVLLLPVVALLLWGLVSALRTRVVIGEGMVLVRRTFTSDGFLLREIRDVRDGAGNHWHVILDDDTSVIVPMDITNHAQISAALLEAAAANRTTS